MEEERVHTYEKASDLYILMTLLTIIMGIVLVFFRENLGEMFPLFAEYDSIIIVTCLLGLLTIAYLARRAKNSSRRSLSLLATGF